MDTYQLSDKRLVFSSFCFRKYPGRRGGDTGGLGGGDGEVGWLIFICFSVSFFFISMACDASYCRRVVSI